MATKSPTTSVRSREIIGGDQFHVRREVFDKHDTVFMPQLSPTSVTPTYVEVEPIITSNHGKTTTNFKRNGPTYSSMRETGDREIEFRTRKYSDNFTSDLNRSDDTDYRRSMTERTRRLSKLRRDFLTSNLHDPSDSPFARTPVRSSMPATSVKAKYKIEVPNFYKFPFAEPYLTPPPVRRVHVDLGPVDGLPVEAKDKENEDPELRARHQSAPVENGTKPVETDHQKLFEQLVKRYSPQRKPVDWTLPPTKPKVIGSVPKSRTGSIDSGDGKKVNGDTNDKTSVNNNTETKNGVEPSKPSHDEVIVNKDENRNSKDVSLTELAETNDRVPELSIIQRQISRETPKRSQTKDMNIPDLIEKMTAEAQDLESHKNDNKKVKRKRSFLDKLLGRKKGNKKEAQ